MLVQELKPPTIKRINMQFWYQNVLYLKQIQTLIGLILKYIESKSKKGRYVLYLHL